MITSDDLAAFGYYDNDQYKPKEEDVKLMLMTPLDMVREYKQVAGQNPTVDLSTKLVLEEFSELWDELDPEHRDFEPLDRLAALKEMADLVYVVYGLADTLRLNLDEALRRVHKNNMGRMYQEDGTIKRREDGKIVKRPGYPKVALEDLI